MVKLIEMQQFLEKQVSAPAVVHEVVFDMHQRVGLDTPPHQQPTHQRQARDVDGAVHFLLDPCDEALLIIRRDINAAQGSTGLFVHTLVRHSFAVVMEGGAEDLMTLDDLVETALQQRLIDPATYADHTLGVIGTGVRHPVQAAGPPDAMYRRETGS